VPQVMAAAFEVGRIHHITRRAIEWGTYVRQSTR
jgi:hypothetical protein